MACRTLLRRRTQLALLSGACQQRAASFVRLRRQKARGGKAHLVALERDRLLLAWTNERVAEAEAPGCPVEVRFEHEGEHYVFFAISGGVANRGSDEAHPPPALALSLPLRVERARQREQLRLSLAHAPAIVATFTHVVDGRRQFEARLTDIGDGGIGVSAKAGDVGPLHTGDLFWLETQLPGEPARCEFVMRLIHLRPLRNSEHLAMGWAFQPADDEDSHEKHLRRLEAYVARQQAHEGVRGAD